ncbi:hypothetical protein [Rhizobium sp. Root482]|uniref:hypothetical protein n=1 Tax=Rhizobium sp. Root482 TaxID=1736543 RepID=UPI0006F5B18D|nr:hypothetical protein [Rhizobium sp. Root482]KQY14074.1 hypothetical protein ASD31_13025 [Rhizobium sp. Root482]
MTDPKNDGLDAETIRGRPGKGMPDKDAPMTAATWAPEPPALDLGPVPDSGRNLETEADDPGAPPARSGRSQRTEDPAKANSETGRVEPSSRVPPEVVGNRSA